MARPDKAAAVAELSKKFTSSSGIVLTEYRGLSVKALKELRRSLGDNATYAVSKNTLTTIAAREAGVPGIEAHLVGPTAIAFVDGDAVVVAKGLRDFARTHPHLVIKGGVLDGKFLGPDEVRKLADLESREVLLAKVAGGMKGILQQAISLISAPLSQTARLLAALEEAAKENPSLIGGPGEPSSADVNAAEPSSSDVDEAEPSGADLAAAEDTSEPSNADLAAAASGADLAAAASGADSAAAASGADLAAAASGADLAATSAGAELAAEDADTSEPTNEELAAAAADQEPAAAAAPLQSCSYRCAAQSCSYRCKPGGDRRRRRFHDSARCGRQLGKDAHHGEAQHRRAP